LKTCNKCGLSKLLKHFYKDRSKADNHHTLCKVCSAANDKTYRAANRERIRENKNRWETANRIHCNTKAREYAAKNRERRRELIYASIKKKPWKRCAAEAKRRAAKLFATPVWADLNLIETIYKTCPKGYHVDHVIPLQGKTVCGLHIESNLQHLPAFDNFIKSNKF